jgi:uncharacterized protein (TIGR02246 family)
MTVVQDLASKWRNAYNSGDARKIADLYVPDVVFSSGVLGMLKGETALAAQMKKTPQDHPSGSLPKRECHLHIRRVHVPRRTERTLRDR